MTKGHKEQNTGKFFLKRKETGMGPATESSGCVHAWLYTGKIHLQLPNGTGGACEGFPFNPTRHQLSLALFLSLGILLSYLILCSSPCPKPMCVCVSDLPASPPTVFL